MNKYSGFSDVIINAIIADKLGFASISYDKPCEFVFCRKNGSNVTVKHDFCRSHEDAFKLMIENKISLESGKNSWHASDGDKLSVAHENPCRSIAECYLLMKDAEKNNGANNT